MATRKKTAGAASESAQNPSESAGVSQPQEAENAAQKAAETAGKAVLFREYAVTAPGGLRLRGAPALDAQTVAILPRGAGVWTGPAEKLNSGWISVRTGTLSGYVKGAYLTAVNTDGAE